VDYKEFLKSKTTAHKESGFMVGVGDLNPLLFDWQKELVRWALYKGRSALFEDCGLGKTPQQLEWSRCVHEKTGGNILILAPLAVSQQTRREGDKFNIPVNVCKTEDDVLPGINITNYERLNHFSPDQFTGIVLDESSILKNFSGKIRTEIIETFLSTPYKLCCTATPSPNDYTELGNTAEFLGVMTRPEMLSMFFINDTGNTTASWRLKGHVKDNLFWEWLASWSIMMQLPSDIGFDDNGFILPELKMHEHIIPYTGPKEGLFVEPAATLSERRSARKESLDERVELTSRIVNDSDETWLIWCNLNAESEALKQAIHSAVEVKGSDKNDHKTTSMLDFADGKIKCLVSKPSIAGFGMNFQKCHNMAFVGLSDSYEQFYQAVRRCWRFGQDSIVNAHIVTGEREGAVVANIKRKEADMQSMYSGMVSHMAELMKAELTHQARTTTEYVPKIEMKLPRFLSCEY